MECTCSDNSCVRYRGTDFGAARAPQLGDPCCTWKPGADADLLFQTAASHPGFPQSVPSAEAQATLDKVNPLSPPQATDNTLTSIKLLSHMRAIYWILCLAVSRELAISEQMVFESPPLLVATGTCTTLK